MYPCHEQERLGAYVNDKYLWSSKSSRLPAAMMEFWASLWRKELVSALPIFKMMSPVCKPHFAAKLPGFTCESKEYKHWLTFW